MEDVCGPEPPMYPPECDTVGDTAYAGCMAAHKNDATYVPYCLVQRQVAVDLCFENEKKEMEEYAQRYLEWERCMGRRARNR
jgi:hypothetical protein